MGFFKIWLEENQEKGYNYYKNLIIGKLNLDKMNGLSQSLDTWEPEQLISILNGLGEFKTLPQLNQDQVIGQIRSRMGTLEDIIRIMSSTSRSIENL